MHASRNQLKRWLKLKKSKYRILEEAFLVEGEKVVAELIAAQWPFECLLLREDRKDKWIPIDAPSYFLSAADFKKLSQDKESEGIMAVAKRRFPVDLDLNPQERYILLYEIANPNNLGAILRSAHWFGISNIVVSENSADITHPKVVRSSMGSLFHLRIVEKQDLLSVIKIMQAHDIKIIATDVSEGTIPHPVGGGVGVVLGNESHGLPDFIKSICDELWHIPGKAKNTSLSLPQAAAIIAYELTKGSFSHESK
ncbi:MAG: RNA methyltransferase [Syntrophales bacterium]|nr:RNA methyltransferase [Syntrophales bacterium]